MKNYLLLIALVFSVFQVSSQGQQGKKKNTKSFNIEKDLLLVPFDCKPDVDDIHTIAAFVMLLDTEKYANLNYHTVAGAYGIQKSMYVPANELFELAFGENWTDIHNKGNSKVKKVVKLVKKVLKAGGDIWIAEAGQSDFSGKVIQAINKKMPDLNSVERFHIVQHSFWNQKVTSPESLKYVREHTDYQKIPDGNKIGNGTPGFRSDDFKDWRNQLQQEKYKDIWNLATKICEAHNGKDGRYYNESIGSGGLDFSDLVEVLWILGVNDINTAEEFFKRYSK